MGKARVLQEGEGVALIGIGTGVGICQGAAALLRAERPATRRWSTRAS